MTPTERVKSRVLELGFSHVGIARAGTLREESAHLETWLARGFHAAMRWMADRKDRRQDPGLVLPGVRSIISAAYNYYTPARHSSDPGVGKISRYAWGADYHAILGKKLRDFEKWLNDEFPGSNNLSYVDTGPVMEKAWAQRAGIGWLGKHTNLITRDRGSWVFLGEVLTTLDLTPDSPETDHCGTCTLCIDACPTDAITEPYVLDSTRCISYLTIEHREALPDELLPHFENWVFGCDICQDVCPWNEKFSIETDDERFAPVPGNAEPDLSEWSRMTETEFNGRFAGSPVRRAKWTGLLRNIRAVRRGRDGTERQR